MTSDVGMATARIVSTTRWLRRSLFCCMFALIAAAGK